MRKPTLIACLSIILAAVLYGALHKQKTQQALPDITPVKVALTVQRLEQTLFNLQDKAAIRAFLQDNATFTAQFLEASSPSAEEALVEQLYSMIQNPHMQALYQEVQQVFGDLSALQQQFETAFRYLKYYYPTFKIPQITTFITGMGTDLYISDDLIVIGLDFFMGEGAKFRPIELPAYLLRGYQPAHIVPKTILLLSQQFIQSNENDATLLADMLYYGKAYYFAQALLPDVQAHTLLAYTSAQLAEVEQHQRLVWEHFVEHELLYTTNHLTKNKYIRDRPFVAEIGPRCPGNIGRWLGWEIIKKYISKHPTIDLPTLMSNQDDQALFVGAQYRPKN